MRSRLDWLAATAASASRALATHGAVVARTCAVVAPTFRSNSAFIAPSTSSRKLSAMARAFALVSARFSGSDSTETYPTAAVSEKASTSSARLSRNPERNTAKKNDAPAAPTVEYTASLTSSSSSRAAPAWSNPAATVAGDVRSEEARVMSDDAEVCAGAGPASESASDDESSSSFDESFESSAPSPAAAPSSPAASFAAAFAFASAALASASAAAVCFASTSARTAAMAASSSAAMRSSRSKRFKSVADGSNPRARTASAYARSWLSLLRASHPVCSLMAARSLVSESPSTSFLYLSRMAPLAPLPRTYVVNRSAPFVRRRVASSRSSHRPTAPITAVRTACTCAPKSASIASRYLSIAASAPSAC
mmetsp:Transcript_2112/g.8918  ORF Transcript_2112/g.8918 Transcript_2112/m.8918 type:complete len:367 (-) Transcript_2112:1916-3016(-)